jgi:hypothetical protein
VFFPIRKTVHLGKNRRVASRTAHGLKLPYEVLFMTTIEIPTPSADLMTQVENVTVLTLANEALAIALIREKFTPYAKHAGFVRIAYSKVGNQNWSSKAELYHEQDGKRVRALLVRDEFDEESTEEFRGAYTGWRLYLTAGGEWLKIKRDGNWSQWQGESQGWGCGVSALSYEMEDHDMGGCITTLTDEEVARGNGMEAVLACLSKSMADMCVKLPERYGKLKARAELAQRTVEALS